MAENVSSRQVKAAFSKRRVAAAAVVILLVLFMARPGGARLKARITNAISRSVARPTDIGSVQIRFLPRPGFDLENLVIYEDPAFGSEPMLRAPEVTAVVRLTSLLRGRLDISRLELTEPSLNLVRREDGRWNWNSLLERTARTPLAPTAKSKSEARPGFPYIEATSGRINFKNGAEKKPYALLNADFDVWQESENSWGVRLKGEPLRTDMNLSDTGLLQISGTWQRAASLRETPLQLTMEWQHVQLGQLTKLVTGNDKGWRGDAQVETKLNGTPGALHVTAEASIGDFHRYDISSSDGPRLAARCEGNYSVGDDVVREVFCTAPVGDGRLTLKGDAGLPGSHKVDLALDVDNVPVSSIAQLALRAKRDLPQDLAATGNMQGVFEMKEPGLASKGPAFTGRGVFSNVQLQSAANRGELAPTNVPFVLQQDNAGVRARSSKQSLTAAVKEDPAAKLQDEIRIEYGPFPVALGRPVPAQVRGWVGRSGYLVTVRGDAEISHALRIATLVGLQAVKANVAGTAQLDLRLAGAWSENSSGNQEGFLLPRMTGTAQMHNVQANIAGLNRPIEITSAKLRLGMDTTRMDDLSAQAAGAHWDGWIELPRGCGTPGACVAQFDLNADDIRASDLHQWLGQHSNQRRWYEVLSPEEPEVPSILENLRAVGNITVQKLLIHEVVAKEVSASIEMERGRVKVLNLRADFLDGKHRGDWRADFNGATSIFSGTGTLTGISLEQLAVAMHDPWITGTGAGTYQFKVSGGSSTPWWQVAEGSLRFDLRDGMMPHLSLASDAGPLRFAQWQGRARLHDGKIEIEKGELVSPTGAYEVSGSASLTRTLDLKLVTETQAKSSTGAGSLIYSITGTVAEPQVTLTPINETHAELKP